MYVFKKTTGGLSYLESVQRVKRNSTMFHKFYTIKLEEAVKFQTMELAQLFRKQYNVPLEYAIHLDETFVSELAIYY